MEVRANTQMQERSTALVIAMLSALTISNSLTARPMWRTGNQVRPMSMQAQASMAVAALRLTFGKQIRSARHSQCMRAPPRARHGVTALIVVTMVLTASRVFATRTVVTCNHIAWETRTFSDLDHNFRLIPRNQSLLQHSSSQMMAQTTGNWLKSSSSTRRMERELNIQVIL